MSKKQIKQMSEKRQKPSTMLDRRTLLAGTAIGIVSAGKSIKSAPIENSEPVETDRPLVISTWAFGKPANEVALKRIADGGSILDAVESGIRHAESAGLPSVGLSGQPNGAGYVQQDACIMHGPGHQAGSVAGIEGIRHPISVARRVMERTPHVLLVGEGAREFALQQNCESVSIEQHRSKLNEWKSTIKASALKDSATDADHDTIALLILGNDGTLSGGCSTSGLARKMPGRVGDSPIIGSGLYVDNEVGAAGATGVGENIMRYCATFMIVEFMRQGLDPTSACKKLIERIASVDPNAKQLHINFIALDKRGRYGAAGTDDFPHSVATPRFSKVINAKAVKI